ncbi:MAG TPA: EutN/CcmL family microcompartment protein, partial [Verrucomicrobiae bacterium]|nr:EutN/CcmL family microcompartment protein [Verrucomicrobiae bacterium]
MNLGRIVGRVVATPKDEGLTGSKLLLVQPLDASLRPRGAILVAADAAGAGAGEIIFYVRGREAAHAFLPAAVPTDAGVTGVVDAIHPIPS